MRKVLICKLLVLILLLLPSIVFSETITGKVIKVADGDTITILTPGNEQIKIRLSAVDTPEGGQAYGKKAKQFTSRMVYKKNVQVEKETVDRYGRTIGFVYIEDANLSEEIIRNGYGWVYRKYCTADYCNDWLKLEKAARDAQIGLWADKNPQPPWEWRAEHRNGNGSGSNVSVAKSSSAVIPGAGGSIVYHGNRRSHVFHGPSCRDYNCKNCTVRLESVQEAVGAGYRAHSECVRE